MIHASINKKIIEENLMYIRVYDDDVILAGRNEKQVNEIKQLGFIREISHQGLGKARVLKVIQEN